MGDADFCHIRIALGTDNPAFMRHHPVDSKLSSLRGQRSSVCSSGSVVFFTRRTQSPTPAGSFPKRWRACSFPKVQSVTGRM
ncbi:protein of unknown function [Thauera humireducens]|nr:protein of unknown function [Thauera humireducens]